MVRGVNTYLWLELFKLVILIGLMNKWGGEIVVKHWTVVDEKNPVSKVMYMKNYKKLTLADLGAENCINLLKPVKCDCGCGGYGNSIIEDENGEYNPFAFANMILENEECQHAFVFVISDWDVSGAFTSEDGIKFFTTAENGAFDNADDTVACVREMIKEFEPHCVGILQYTGSDNAYRVVTDVVYD